MIRNCFGAFSKDRIMSVIFALPMGKNLLLSAVALYIDLGV